MDSELLTKTAYAVSLLINAVFIIIATYVLWRIESSTSKTNQAVKESTERMAKTLENLQRWGNGFQTWGKQFIESAKGVVQPTLEERTQASSIALDDQLQKVVHTIESLDVARLKRLINELDLMIRAMKDEPNLNSSSIPESPISQPIGQASSALRQELEHLQTRLSDATKVVYDLRRENRASLTSTSALEALRLTNERLFAELKHRREKQSHIDDRLERIQEMIRGLSSQNTKIKMVASDSMDADQQDQLIDLQARLESVENERTQLNKQLSEIENALGRTLREKEMIEDRFLSLARD